MRFADSTLVDGIFLKDEKAFEVMYERYFPKVYNYTFLHVGEAKRSEEITEQIFTEVIQTLDRCHDLSTLSKWFFKVTRKHIHRIQCEKKMEFNKLCQEGKECISGFFRLEEALLSLRNTETFCGG